MKRLKTIPTVALLVVTFNYSYSQINNVRISVGANYPFINSHEEPAAVSPVIPSSAGFYAYTMESLSGVKESFKSQVGASGKVTFDLPVTSKWFFSTGLGLDYYRFQKTTQIILPDQNSPSLLPTTSIVGNPFGFIGYWEASPDNTAVTPGTIKYVDLQDPAIFGKPSEKIGMTSNWSISIPVLFGTSILKNKLMIQGGLSVGMLLHASVRKQRLSMTQQNKTFEEIYWGADETRNQDSVIEIIDYKDTSTKEFENFQFSSLVRASYKITNRWGVDLTSQLFFTSIYKDNDTSKFKTVAIGASYKIL